MNKPRDTQTDSTALLEFPQSSVSHVTAKIISLSRRKGIFHTHWTADAGEAVVVIFTASEADMFELSDQNTASENEAFTYRVHGVVVSVRTCSEAEYSKELFVRFNGHFTIIDQNSGAE